MGAVQDTSLVTFGPKDGFGYPEFIILHELEGSHQEQGAHPHQEALEREGFCDVPTSACQCDGDVVLGTTPDPQWSLE